MTSTKYIKIVSLSYYFTIIKIILFVQHNIFWGGGKPFQIQKQSPQVAPHASSKSIYLPLYQSIIKIILYVVGGGWGGRSPFKFKSNARRQLLMQVQNQFTQVAPRERMRQFSLPMEALGTKERGEYVGTCRLGCHMNPKSKLVRVHLIILLENIFILKICFFFFKSCFQHKKFFYRKKYVK